jgi:hypothetical protein
VRVVVQGCWADKDNGQWGQVFELVSRPCCSDLTCIQLTSLFGTHNPMPHFQRIFRRTSRRSSVGSPDGLQSVGSPTPLLTCVLVSCLLIRISVTFGYTLRHSSGDLCCTVAHYGHQCCGVTTAHTAYHDRTPLGYPVGTPDTAFVISWFPVSCLCYGLSDVCVFTCTRIPVFKRDVLSTAQHPGNPLRYPPSSRTLSTLLLCLVAPQSNSEIGLWSRARAQRMS